MGQQEALPHFSSSYAHEHLHGNSHQQSPRQPAMVRKVAYLDRKAMSSGCYTFNIFFSCGGSMIEADQDSGLYSNLLKTVFRYIPAQAAQ